MRDAVSPRCCSLWLPTLVSCACVPVMSHVGVTHFASVHAVTPCMQVLQGCPLDHGGWFLVLQQQHNRSKFLSRGALPSLS
jgi:hypothetical protein